MKNIYGIVLGTLLAMSPLTSEAPPLYEMLAHRITLNTAQEIHAHTLFEPIGLGGGMIHNIQTMSLLLRTYKPVTLENARRIIVECTEAYLKRINSNKEVKSFLAEYPFSAKRIDLTVLVLDEEDHFKLGGSLANFYLENGKIVYKVANLEAKKLEIVHEESYEDALSITGKGLLPTPSLP